MCGRVAFGKKRGWMYALIIVCVLSLIVGCGGTSSAVPTDRATPTGQEVSSSIQVAPLTDPACCEQDVGLPRVLLSELPREAQRTIALIKRGGPFPYRQDGTVFQNRERLLPIRPRGYYREYTVPTPGEDDRGARRIVAGQGGEFYYTEDHYESFVRVIEP